MALTVLYDVLKADTNDATKLALINDFDYVLGLELSVKKEEEAEEDSELTAYVEEQIALRKEAKKAKDFAKADAIRNELAAKGIILEDTREGVKWRKA